MGRVTVIGLQWGDEGKGKIVDRLSESADVVIRFQGGHNAGHTLVIEGKTYKLSLLPSGTVRPGKIGVIGAGAALDPVAFLQEVERVKAQDIVVTPENLKIAENICLILSVHGELDRLREEAAGAAKIGTTGRGIGPAYEDKVGRRAVRLADLRDRDNLRGRLERLLTHHNALRVGLGAQPVTVDALEAEILQTAPHILAYAADVTGFLHQADRAGKSLLYEGAQGVLLDVDHGTYPYVTSSNTGAAQAISGGGYGGTNFGYGLGILKAYCTRVGSGPFPTELTDETGNLLGERGREFGTVTGRKRRCGWFDAVLARRSVMIAGIHGVALTKPDVLDVFETLKICVAYELDGKKLDYLPACSSEQFRVKPIYETFPGWRVSTEGVKNFEDLPENAVRYFRKIEELIACPIAMISTSPRREDMIFIRETVV